MSFSAGLSITVEATAGVPDVESTKVSATASFSYTYDTSTGTTQDSSTTDVSNTQVSISPAAGQVCTVAVDQIFCPGTISVTTPVTFVGDIVITNFETGKGDGATAQGYSNCDGSINGARVTWDLLPGGTSGGHICDAVYSGATAGNYQYFFELQQLVQVVGSTASTDLVQQVTGGLHSTGNFNLICTNADGSPISQSSTYQPTLTCPTTLRTVPNSCGFTPKDYFQTQAVVSDYQNWGANQVAFSQTPSPNNYVTGYGPQTITFDAVVAADSAAKTVTCSSIVDVVPPYFASFEPEFDTLASSSDGSPFSAVYTTSYNGLCDQQQAGSCWISAVKSQNSKTFSWIDTGFYALSSPKQELQFSNGGQPWPAQDVLTFITTCDDTYGNNGGGGEWTQPGESSQLIFAEITH